MDIDAASVDEVLATTRAVRRRLDLERPVDNELLLDCIDLAEQAPTGGNLGSRRWIIVRDQAVKDQLGELYRDDRAAVHVPRPPSGCAAAVTPQERVMASAAYLAEHLAEVPAIVIPTIIGRHDGSGRPGLFDSVIQAAWSFCLALRARGPRHDWVTAALQDEARVKEILGIPAAHDRDRAACRWRGRRAPTSAARRGIRRGRSRSSTASAPRPRPGPATSCASPTGPALVVEVDIDASRPRRVGAGHRPRRCRRGSPTSSSAPSGQRRRARRRRRVHRAQPPPGDRRVDDPVLRRRVRRAAVVRLVHVRPRRPGRPLALRPRTARRPDPPAVQLRASGPGRRARRWRSPPTPARRPAVLRRRLDEVQRQHAAHRRGHQAARRGRAVTLRVGIAAVPLQRRPASSSSARPSGSASTRCGCPSSGPPTRSRRSRTSPRRQSTIRLGTGIVQLGARTPAMLAMSAHVAAGAVRRPVRARHRHERPAGDGGLARRPLRPAGAPHPRDDRDRPRRSPPANASSTTARSTSCRCPAARAARSAR